MFLCLIYSNLCNSSYLYRIFLVYLYSLYVLVLWWCALFLYERVSRMMNTAFSGKFEITASCVYFWATSFPIHQSSSLGRTTTLELTHLQHLGIMSPTLEKMADYPTPYSVYPLIRYYRMYCWTAEVYRMKSSCCTIMNVRMCREKSYLAFKQRDVEARVAWKKGKNRTGALVRERFNSLYFIFSNGCRRLSIV